MINYRGVSHRLTTGVPFTSLEYESFKQPLLHLIKRNAGREVFLLGVSLGGNMAANLVADPELDNGSIKAAVLSQPALDLVKVQAQMEKSLFGFYSKRFGSGFKDYMQMSGSVDILRQEFKAKDS